MSAGATEPSTDLPKTSKSAELSSGPPTRSGTSSRPTWLQLVIGEPARQMSWTWSVVRQSPPTSDSDLMAITMASDAIWNWTTSSPTDWQASHSAREIGRNGADQVDLAGAQLLERLVLAVIVEVDHRVGAGRPRRRRPRPGSARRCWSRRCRSVHSVGRAARRSPAGPGAARPARRRTPEPGHRRRGRWRRGRGRWSTPAAAARRPAPGRSPRCDAALLIRVGIEIIPDPLRRWGWTAARRTARRDGRTGPSAGRATPRRPAGSDSAGRAS